MELRQYVAVIWRWLWLIVLATAIAAGSSYWASRSMPLVFQSSTTLMVGQSIIQDPNVTSQDLMLSQQLAQTYVQMATRQPILQATIDSLGLGTRWDELKTRVNASLVQGTQLMQIAVLDTNAQRAAVTADEIAQQLIQQSPTAPEEAQRSEHRDFVEQQVADLQAKIEAGQAQISELEQSLGEAFSARQIQDLQGQINVLQTQIDTWQANYAQMLNFIEGGSPNYLTVIEPAQVSTRPVSPRTGLNVLLAASVGLILALGAAFLLEYLDDTIKTSEDVLKTLELPPLATITRIKGEGYDNKLISMRHPRSPISEAYRTLRTNIQFSTLDRPARTLLVTSASSVEGKSVTSANLAVTMAQAGLRTVLIDSDLRRPVQHKIFHLSNQNGLTNALLQEGEPSAEGHLQATEVENLYVLTSGPIPPNPSELLGSKKMQQLLAQLQSDYDILIFDSPPVLAVTDATVLATRLDGVLLVTDSGSTRREMALRARDTLLNVGGHILGIVVNRLSARSSGYRYYYYYHYHYYYAGNGSDRRDGNGGTWWQRLLGGRNNHNGEPQAEPHPQTIDNP